MDPNTDFFIQNGSFNDKESLLCNSQFLLVRHGESTMNIAVQHLEDAFKADHKNKIETRLAQAQ